MNQISVFFKKFSYLLIRDEEIKHTVQETIKHQFLISLTTKQFKVSNGIVFIKAHPTIRHKIIAQKQKLITELKEKGLEIWNVV